MRQQIKPICRQPVFALPVLLGILLLLAANSLTLAQQTETAPTSQVNQNPDSTSVSSEVPPVLEMSDHASGEATPSANPQPTQEQPGSAEKQPKEWTIVGVLLTIWRAELFSASGSPIKLNQIVLAIFIILVGLWVSKRISVLVRKRISRIHRIDSHAAAVVQNIVFNVLAIVLVLAAMPIAGIPITIFTVIGGAVAIGIGFGAQNLFNNLISSLIIMLERPIRLGDIVEVGDHEGIIEAINNRCTTIRRSDGIDVLIPNSHFLEQPVVNWTLTDRDVRGKVVVGVAYGSPTDQVAKLFRQALDEQQLIHKTPEPIILFEEFGDNALIFEGYFWSRLSRPMDLKKIQSDVRFRFDELTREAGIVIAFPQRDVHLDTLRPLEVRMINKDNAGT